MCRTTCLVTRLTRSDFWQSSLLPGLQCCFVDEPSRGAHAIVEVGGISRSKLKPSEMIANFERPLSANLERSQWVESCSSVQRS